LQYIGALAYTGSATYTSSLSAFTMSSAQYTTSSYAKFIIPLQGGFDGGSPSKNICIG